jgi:acyl CoA:acetate/3-ketoacid CoA transferase alpha subunit
MANLTRWSGFAGVGGEAAAGHGLTPGCGTSTMTRTSPVGAGPSFTSLEDAVARHVRPGDSVHVMLGHSRWTAAARELAVNTGDSIPEFTLVMTSLGALGALFFRGRPGHEGVTAYSGNSFPTYTPNPVFRRAYESGEVEVEHWSILTLTQRMEAAARGLPAAVTGSLAGSSMAANEGFAEIDSPFGPPRPRFAAGARRGARPRRRGRPRGQPRYLSEPLLEGVWGAWAARRGVVATVEQVVEDRDRSGAPGAVPAHRVLAVVETPFGAHPGGCYAPGLPVHSYGEDIAFWNLAADAAAKGFVRRLRHGMGARAVHPRRVPAAAGNRPPALARRSVRPGIVERGCRRHTGARRPGGDAVGAGGGVRRPGGRAGGGRGRGRCGVGRSRVANLAAWVAVGRARAAGSRVTLTAELGLWGYEPTPADPYIFNHRVFPGTPT